MSLPIPDINTETIIASGPLDPLVCDECGLKSTTLQFLKFTIITNNELAKDLTQARGGLLDGAQGQTVLCVPCGQQARNQKSRKEINKVRESIRDFAAVIQKADIPAAQKIKMVANHVRQLKKQGKL